MAQLLTVRLNKNDHQPLGFRLQGGKDFGTPLVVQKVNGGSAAERAGLQAGDALIRVNTTDVYTLRHQEAQDAIRAAGAALELTVQRGGGTWRPAVTPTGSLPRPSSRPLGATPSPVTSTSLKATSQPSRAFGSGHNSVAKPFGYMNGNDPVKSVVNKQYNTPVNMYSEQTIAETLSAQTEVLAGGVLGVNFKKNEKGYDAEKSAVYKVLQEEQNDPEPEISSTTPVPPVSGLRHVQAPTTRPDAPLNTGGLPPGQNICEECERLIIGVFVRIKDKNLHVECFKCSTCGSSLKNQGYYNLNGKLYCDIHAKLIARQNPPASHLEPVTVPPGGRIPTNTYSTPLPPLTTNSYTNGSSSLFSPSSNLSGPKPFGSSIGSAYSPASLSPRSGPVSPARPVVAPAPLAPSLGPSLAPAAPFAPTNEMSPSVNTNKLDFKSPAEERLIRKMAKMALNGYEIGIQRKIKPGDHIQLMADKIQNTVVTKHPLNSDNTLATENNSETFFNSSTIKQSDKDHKLSSNISYSDKIKKNSTTNYPLKNNGLNNNIPLPPPMPYDIQNTNFNTDRIKLQKNLEITSSDADITSDHINVLSPKRIGEINVEKPNAPLTETLRKNNAREKAAFLNGMNSTQKHDFHKFDINTNNFSNTLEKKKNFEKNNIHTDFNNSTLSNRVNSNTSIIKDNVSSELSHTENNISNQNLHKSEQPTFVVATNIGANKTESDNNKIEKEIVTQSKTDEGDEFVVRRRQKKNDKNSDGRRDSHITTRPLSTMTSVDIVDGLYPVCHVCDTAITRGPFITALGRIWCPDHFVCVNATCRRPLQDIGFVEENGQLYCEYCFEQYIAPACDKCHAKIKGDCLNAIGKHFHPECFNCVYCGKLFGNNPFFLEDGLPYCEADWNELFTTKCFACGFPVEAGDRWVEALNNNYHSQCFNCTVCKKNLEGQSFFAKGGRPFCKAHAR